MKDLTRRKFVIQSSKLLAFIPFVGVTGCLLDKKLNLSAKDALKRLIYIIGPWTMEDNFIANDFANRFLKTDFANQYLPNSVALVQTLSKQISNETTVVKDINLNNIPVEEKKMLINLSKQLYSFIEIRLYASNEPAWGQCQGNAKWHVRIPE